MPRLRIPPLPSSKLMGELISSTRAVRTPGVQARELQKRLWLVNPELTNRFVRELGVREGEVVIDAYCGYGSMTRAFLAGGRDETTAEDWNKVRAEQEVVGPEAGQVRRANSGQFTFPPWDVDKVRPPEFPPLEPGEKVVLPSLVIANDPAISCLSRGLGFFPDLAPPSKWDFLVPQPTELQKRFQKEAKDIYPSILEKERLVFSPESVYSWPTIPKLLSHKLVTPHLPVYDETKEGVERYQRPWDAPAPPITMMSVIQESMLGDQLINQWISSAIGSKERPHSWMWKWGRIRLAFLVPRNTYDRLMAKEGEACRSKISVMASALFKLRPLPPYHHVPDVDKGSLRTDPRVDAPRPKSHKAKGSQGRLTKPAPPPIDEVTPTVAGDFFPISYRLRVQNKAGSKVTPVPSFVLERPALLGLELMPRDDSPILPEQRDAWDFVLRKMFVREAATVGEMLPSLAFGADNLLPKLQVEEDSPYAGDAVSADDIVRCLTEKQWHRIVDVFSKWAFKPDMMHYDMEVFEDTREVGLS